MRVLLLTENLFFSFFLFSFLNVPGMIRPGLGQQQQQQGMMMTGQQLGPVGSSSIHGGAPSSVSAPAGVFPDVDMSHLSEEERLLIESVMAKAQMEELEQSVKPANLRYTLLPLLIVTNFD